jgi:tetratricopeptide (TPR) repeat protein
VLVSLAVNPWGFTYELPKAVLLRELVVLMVAAHFLVLAWAPQPPSLRRWLRRPLVRPVLLVAGAAFFSTFSSLDPLLSLRGTLFRQQGLYFLLCFVLWALLVAAHLRTPPQRRRLLTTIAVTGTLVALTPFAEALYWHKNPLTWRPGGSLGNPIFLGAYLIMVLPFTLARLISDFRTNNSQVTIRRRLTWSVALALQLFALAITQSRGPWVGALVGVALFATLLLWSKHRRLVVAVAVAVCLFIGALLVGLNFGLAPASRLSQLPYVQRVVLPQGLSTGTVRVRIVLWEAGAGIVTTWPEIGLKPDRLHAVRPLLGYGPDTASAVYNSVYPPELAHIEDPDALWDRIHNETLDLLTMQGWLGVAAYLVLGVACARQGWKLWRAARTTAERAWIAAPLAALAAHVVEVQFAFSVTATAMMGWLCVAWLAAPSPSPGACGASPSLSRSAGEGGGRGVGEGLRWRIYALIGALLLVFVAIRLEGGAIWADTLVGRARALDQAGQWGKSIELYDRALALVPWQAAYHQFRGEAFYNLARALPEGETALRTQLLEAADRSLARARRLEPLELELYSNAGVLHAYWSDTVDPAHLETAVAFYEQAFRLAPTRAELRTDLGHVYHNHGLYEEALAQYRAALEIDPQFATAYYGLGQAWLALEQPDQARQAFQAALDVAPDCEVCREALQGLGQ